MINHPRRKPNRLKDYNYSTPGTYFITICSQNKAWMFWRVGACIASPPSTAHLSSEGRIVDEKIRGIPKRYPAITLDNYVVMPNHVHILFTSCPEEGGRAMLAPTVEPRASAPDISVVVQQFKGAVTKSIGNAVWQKGFHDHVVRNEKGYWKIYEYIENNPLKWELDSLNIWK